MLITHTKSFNRFSGGRGQVYNLKKLKATIHHYFDV